MAIKTEKDIFVQVGITSLRSPTGEFLSSVPLYVKATEIKKSGLTKGEEKVIGGVIDVFCDVHKMEKEKEKNE